MDHLTFAQLLGNYGEFVGAIAVVATLVYLTTQIRQNTRSINSNNNNNVMTGFNQINVVLASDPEAARIFGMGFSSFEELNEVEQVRFRHLLNGFFNIYRNLYHQYLDATFSQEHWEPWAREARQMMETPGVIAFRDFTKTYEDLFSYLEKMPDDTPKPLKLSSL